MQSLEVRNSHKAQCSELQRVGLFFVLVSDRSFVDLWQDPNCIGIEFSVIARLQLFCDLLR